MPESLLLYLTTCVSCLQLSLCLIKKPAKVIYAVKAHAVVVTIVMLGGVLLLLYKVISGGDLVLQVIGHHLPCQYPQLHHNSVNCTAFHICILLNATGKVLPFSCATDNP